VEDRAEDEVAEVYARACGPLIGLLTVMGGSASEAEEIAQEAFVKLLVHWPRVRAYDDIDAWLRLVAVRLLVSRHRRATVARLGLGRLAARSTHVAPGPSPDGLDLMEALARLPVASRAVLVLHHLHDLPAASAPRRTRPTPAQPPPFGAVLERRRVRQRRKGTLAACGAAVLLVAGTVGTMSALGDGTDGRTPAVDPPSSSPPVSPAPSVDQAIPDTPPEWDDAKAPPVVLWLDGREERLEPWTSCYWAPDGRGACIDGMPVPPFADVGQRDTVEFRFPLPGWTFQATFTPLSENVCERSITVDVRPTGTYVFEVPLAGAPGDYQVDLFGRAPEGGDVIMSFRWSTSERGRIPTPRGYAGVIGGNREETHVYAPEIGLQDIADLAERPTATITVTAANGRSTTLPGLRATQPCWKRGSVFFRGADADSAGVLALGPAPYTYTVDLVLDGTTYTGTGTWPADEERGNEPYVTLDFSPALPGYSG